MQLKSIALLSCLLVSGLAPSPVAGSETIMDPRGWNFYPLEFYQLVVSGTITGVRTDHVSAANMWLIPQAPVERVHELFKAARFISLDVREVLRGMPADSVTIMVYMFDDDFDTAYSVGDTVLLCANYHPNFKMYYLQSSYGKYVSQGGEWVCTVCSGGTRALTDEALRAMVGEMSLERVTEQAELIVEGRLATIDEEGAWSQAGTTAGLTRAVLRIERVRKGAYGDEEIPVMLDAGVEVPLKRMLVTRLQAGQSVYAFLKRNDAGWWYPFAGANGMFVIQDDQLLYVGGVVPVPFWHTRAEVDSCSARVAVGGRPRVRGD